MLQKLQNDYFLAILQVLPIEISILNALIYYQLHSQVMDKLNDGSEFY